jgi:hypothetical protein
VRLYTAVFATDPRLLQGICIFLMTAVTFWLASSLTWNRLSMGAIARGDAS